MTLKAMPGSRLLERDLAEFIERSDCLVISIENAKNLLMFKTSVAANPT